MAPRRNAAGTLRARSYQTELLEMASKRNVRALSSNTIIFVVQAKKALSHIGAEEHFTCMQCWQHPPGETSRGVACCASLQRNMSLTESSHRWQTIIILPTGTGKTFISAMWIKARHLHFALLLLVCGRPYCSRPGQPVSAQHDKRVKIATRGIHVSDKEVVTTPSCAKALVSSTAAFVSSMRSDAELH